MKTATSADVRLCEVLDVEEAGGVDTVGYPGIPQHHVIVGHVVGHGPEETVPAEAWKLGLVDVSTEPNTG